MPGNDQITERLTGGIQHGGGIVALVEQVGLCLVDDPVQLAADRRSLDDLAMVLRGKRRAELVFADDLHKCIGQRRFRGPVQRAHGIGQCDQIDRLLFRVQLLHRGENLAVRFDVEIICDELRDQIIGGCIGRNVG